MLLDSRHISTGWPSRKKKTCRWLKRSMLGHASCWLSIVLRGNGERIGNKWGETYLPWESTRTTRVPRVLTTGPTREEGLEEVQTRWSTLCSSGVNATSEPPNRLSILFKMQILFNRERVQSEKSCFPRYQNGDSMRSLNIRNTRINGED